VRGQKEVFVSAAVYFGSLRFFDCVDFGITAILGLHAILTGGFKWFT
jgi:hypothetical protein